MAQHIQSFIKGIDKDSSVNKYPNNVAYHIENFRYITDEGLTTMSLENIKGTSLVFQIDSGYLIWGHYVLRDTLIILAIASNKVGNAATDRIYVRTINADGTLTGSSYIYQGALELSLTTKITSIVGRYESEDIQKIYWTDEVHGIKFANIVDPDIASKPADWFNYLPTFTKSNITINSIGVGSIKTGVVQYAYQLYNLYGSSTKFITPSNLTPLSESLQSGSDILFTGSDIDTNSGKSITFTISNLDTDFNRIKVVRILHTSLLNDPEITIIYDSTFTSTLKIIDLGTQNFGTLSKSEFNFTCYDFVPKHLETKNNILFASNITESSWDIDDTVWDARAYRYNSSGDCTIYAEDGSSEALTFTYSQLIADTISGGDNGKVPITHDCFNNQNDIVLDTTGTNLYKYSSGTTIGGRGKNVSYTFSTEAGIFDPTPTEPTTDTTMTSTSNVNSIRVSAKVGYMRDEIYPHAIVLYNSRGQKSYPKWIGDIRFPSVFDSILTYKHSTSGAYYNLYINFTITNLNLIPDCVAFEIVRCERTAADRTILAQGIIGAARTYTGEGGATWNCPAIALPTVEAYRAGSGTVARSQTLDRTLLEFISPEISYGNDITYASGDYIEICGSMMYNSQRYKTNNNSSTFSTASTFNLNYNYDVLVAVNKLQTSYTLKGNRTVSRKAISNNGYTKSKFIQSAATDGNIIPNNQTVITTHTYENYIRHVGGANTQGFHGTTGLIAVDSSISFNTLEFPSTPNTYGKYFPLINYKRPVKGYGGASYEARSTREYIPCSELTLITSSSHTILCTHGDTFVSEFEFHRAFPAGLIGMTSREEFFVDIYKFPVETSINTRWQSNKTFTQFYGNVSNTNAIIMQEIAGSWSKNNVGVIANFTQDKPLYQYNSVYSKQNNTTKFLAKPLDILESVSFDNRIQYSDRKYNNENTDSWTIWRPLNFKDVDNNYGPINATINYNHSFIFFQDSAVGIASIEEREVIPSTNGGIATIGMGGILSRYDYIYTNGGCQDKQSLVMGRYKLYWYDRYNNSLMSYTQDSGVENISKLKGIYSFFNNIGATNITNVISSIDGKFNDIYFTIKTNSTNYTLVYNEMLESFTQFVSIDPTEYINYENLLYSIKTNTDIYLHNVGSYGSFHGTLYPSKLTFVVNPRQMLINEFDLVEFLTNVISSGNELQETFTTIRMYNSYQDTGTITLVPDDNIKRRFRKWRFNLIRDVDEYNSKFKDSYITIELSFTNDGSKHITLSDIIMLYQNSFSK